MAQISVLVADAQRLFAEALSAALEDEPDLSVLRDHPTSGLETVEQVLEHRPDVVLLDYWIRGMEGPTATRAILARVPAQKVLILSWFNSRGHIHKAMAAGALAFLPKTVSVEQVADAVRRAQFGSTSALPVEKRSHSEPVQSIKDPVWERLMSLTPREIEILTLLDFHGRPEAVAETLSIKHGTVRAHIHNILNKMDVRSQIEAIALARRYSLI